MLFKQPKYILRQGLLVSLMAPALFACSKSKFSAVQSAPVEPVEQTYNPRPQPHPTYTPPPYTPPPVAPVYPVQPTPQPVPDCQDYTYPAPQYTGPKAVHVAVALDGSKSNVEERISQLRGIIESYSSVVARNIPIKLALITGHSPESTDSALRGNLFYEYQTGPGGEPDVIVFNAGNGGNQNAYEWLRRKMMGMRTDNSSGISGGGELLTVNTLAVLNDSRLPRLMGMNRGDILNIHFLADENDICTQGTVASDVPRSGLRAGEAGLMREEVARRRHCMQDLKANQLAANNPSRNLLNVFGESSQYSYDMQVSSGYSRRLFDRIKQLSGYYNIHMSAFVYTGETAVPSIDENEVGRGYIELIQALDQAGVKGSIFDLGTLGDTQNVYSAATSMIEEMNESMYTRVQLTDSNGRAIDTNEMDYERSHVVVVSSAGQVSEPIEYRRANTSGYIEVRRGCPIDQSYRLRVRYCRRRY